MATQKSNKNRALHLTAGILLFAAVIFVLPREVFSFAARVASATLFLMVYWWITRPVHIAVTALLPIIINSIFSIVPMADVLKNYASQIVVLLLGANILTITWKNTGLDKRIALKSLCIIGTSVKGQLVVWFLLSTLLSTVLPNAVVAAALCPIAYAMMQYITPQDEKPNKGLLNMILLMIAWGAGLGGFGTPLGGAMNLVAITHIENFIGREFMFIEWVAKMMPYLALLSLGIVAYILLSPQSAKRLPGSADYFRDENKKMGAMGRAQILALFLFAIPVVLSFARPLYAEAFPEFKPFFAFLLFGFIAFIINGEKGHRLITWNQASKGINWGLMILFSGGIAVGNMLVATGTLEGISSLISSVDIQRTLPVIVIIIAFSMFLSNASSNTAAVAVAVPLVLGIVTVISDVPLKYVYITAAACNCAFLLPTSIRAIPVGYGLDTDYMFKKGFIGVAVTFAVLLAAGYAAVML